MKADMNATEINIVCLVYHHLRHNVFEVVL